MSNRKRPSGDPRKAGTDPRRAGGSIAGPGGPQDRNAVVISTENAVLLDHCTVAEMETWAGDVRGTAIAMTLHGRINHTTEYGEILYLMNSDGAAGIVTELLALATRIGPEFYADFQRRMEAMFEADDGSIGTVG